MRSEKEAKTDLSDVLIAGSGHVGRLLAERLAARGLEVLFLARDGVAQAGHATSVPEAVARLKTPRKVLLVPGAGEETDGLLKPLCARLEPTDVICDASDTFFRDTEARSIAVASTGQRYVDLSVLSSGGGDAGDLVLLSSGHRAGYAAIRHLFFGQRGDDGGRMPYLGTGGAAGLVKTVHETLVDCQEQAAVEIQRMLWARGSAGEVSASGKEANTGDAAARERGQVERVSKVGPEGGEEQRAWSWADWARQTAARFSVPVPSLVAASQARVLGTAYVPGPWKKGPVVSDRGGGDEIIEACRSALQAAAGMQVAQGLALVSGVSEALHYGTDLDLVAAAWEKAGSLPADALSDARAAISAGAPGLPLTGRSEAQHLLKGAVPSLRKVVTEAVRLCVPCPVLAAGLVYFDSVMMLRAG